MLMEEPPTLPVSVLPKKVTRRETDPNHTYEGMGIFLGMVSAFALRVGFDLITGVGLGKSVGSTTDDLIDIGEVFLVGPLVGTLIGKRIGAMSVRRYYNIRK